MLMLDLRWALQSSASLTVTALSSTQYQTRLQLTDSQSNVLESLVYLSLILPMASGRFDLETFNGENDFYLWSLKMRAILIQQGLDAALEDNEYPKAKQGKEEGSSSSGVDMETINNKAHNTIILHLSDEVLREVAKEKTASGLWTKLKELFLKKSLAKRLYMKRKLYMFSMKDGTALKDHLNEFNKLILDIENVNIDLEDEDRAPIILSSLPNSYEHFVGTLLYERQTLTLNDEESNGKAAVASEDEGMSDDADVLIAAEKQSSGEWILDLGCSFYMYHNKDFFKTFENIAGGKVLLGNNLVRKVARIGTINIMMFDIEENDMIIMKGIRRNWLYVLVGSTIMSAITTSVSSDRTKLWHMRSEYDSCVYFRKLNSGDQISLLLYVDDMLIAYKHITNIEKLKTEVMAVFEMKDFGLTARILRMQIKRHRHAKTLFLTQSRYLKKVVSRFGILNSKHVSTPLASHFKLSKQQEPEEEADIDHMRRIPYSGTVGSIMCAIVCTRPNVAYMTGLVSRFMGNPCKEHWEAGKWLLRYLKGDLDKRRLVTGLVFTLYGGAVSWKSTLQSVVALSTTEAEYIALTEAVKEALWLKGDEIRNGVVNVIKIPSKVNPADMLTKPLPTVKFRNYLNLIGIVNLYYNNVFYAKVGGISTTEMNLLEVDFLFALGFQLMVCLLVGLENENEGLE
ncbi:hypothetical protein KPL70_025426 [Citrus sinensis]|nr:hypothetical protein KPL70_025426 [Citrus sinensis]